MILYRYVLLSLLALGFGCKKGIEKAEIRTTTLTASSPATTPARSVVMVIAHNGFRDEELKVPYDYLRDKGYNVTVASTDTTEATGMLGMKFKPGILLKEIDPAQYDALIMVGGVGSKIFWDDTTVHRIVRCFADNHKILAAICLAPATLARAGVLKGIKATCFENAADELKKGEAQYTGSQIEGSDNIITASGPEAVKEFAIAIANKLK